MHTAPSMRPDEAALWEAVRLGEDNRLELKEVRFRGRRLDAPARDAIADEIAAFANASGGRLVLGVTDQRTPQALTPMQLDQLMAMVGEVCTDSIRPPVEYEAHRVPTPRDRQSGVLVVDVSPRQSDGIGVDAQPVAGTGINSLHPEHWRR